MGLTKIDFSATLFFVNKHKKKGTKAMKNYSKRLLSVLLSVVILFSAISITAFAQGAAEIKNIIYLIGDGMGPNQLEAYKLNNPGAELVMDTFPVQGFQDTRSFLGILTDSAAGGTALACGIRTWVNAVGVFPADPFAVTSYPKNIREVAQEQGLKTGIVVTKSSDDATPAAFSAHTISRKNDEAINEQQLNSGIDILMGAETGFLNEQNAAENGFAFVTNKTDLDKISSGKVIGQFNGGDLKGDYNENDTPAIDEMTTKAINLLENDKGFFLMVEGSTIDSYCHSNDIEGMYRALRAFDRAVEVALNYAKTNKDTLVVITADHETGGLVWDDANNNYKFTTGGHSAAPVKYFAYSYAENAFNNGEDILNKDIPVRIAETMDWSEFLPATVRTEFGSKIDAPLILIESAWGKAVSAAYETVIGYVPEAVFWETIMTALNVLDQIIMFVGRF